MNGNWRALEENAHRKIAELRQRHDLTAADRGILKRLETHPSMRSEVWSKLPSGQNPQIAGWIITSAMLWAKVATELRPAIPRRKKDFAAYIQRFPIVDATAEGVAIRADLLRTGMRDLEGDAREYWSSLWPGDRKIGFEEACQVIEQIELFYRQLSEERKARAVSLSLPALRKRNADNAPELIFSKKMSDLFWHVIGKPCDEIVATLTNVAFDLKDPVGAATVRGRRRAAAHSRRKLT